MKSAGSTSRGNMLRIALLVLLAMVMVLIGTGGFAQAWPQQVRRVLFAMGVVLAILLVRALLVRKDIKEKNKGPEL